jgi:hypothetical protein
LAGESSDMLIDGVYVGIRLHHLKLEFASFCQSFIGLSAKTLMRNE